MKAVLVITKQQKSDECMLECVHVSHESPVGALSGRAVEGTPHLSGVILHLYFREDRTTVVNLH